MPDTLPIERLFEQARSAAARAYAPYSRFHVGAALLFRDAQSGQDTIITGANFENASYGLSICAETAAILSANHAGLRAGLVAVAIVGGPASDTDTDTGMVQGPHAVTPCGRCRQMLNEVAQLGDTDPVILCGHATGYAQHNLSTLLPAAFGPANLG